MNLAKIPAVWGALMLAALSQIVAGAPFGVKEIRVVGYYWQKQTAELPVADIRYQDLTHIIYNAEQAVKADSGFSAGVTNAQDLADLVDRAHAQGVKVLALIGEGPNGNEAGWFSKVLASPGQRARFISEIVEYVREHDLDGIDYDNEGPTHGSPDPEIYTELIKETRTAFDRANPEWIISMAGAAWPPCFVIPEAYAYLDFINVMSYQSMKHATDALDLWVGYQAPREKLVMGMAVGFGDYGRDTKLAADEVQYVVKNGYGGVMLFQLNYDTRDETSMLKAVGDKIRHLKQGEAAVEDKWINTLKPKGRGTSVLTIAQDGKSNYSIVTRRKGTTQDEKAAEELQQWLKEMTGAELPIARGLRDVRDKSKVISIGRTRMLQRSELPEAKEDLADEGYGIAVKDERLYLWGGRTRGVINAVFALLEEDLGCRWYTNESVNIPRRPTLTFAPVSRTYKPALKLRDPFYFVAFDGTWSLRNRTNAPGAKVPEEWGGYMEYCGGDSTDHASMFVHTFHDLLAPSDYYEEHPEYFMLGEDGKRNTHQLCTTHPDVVRIVTESAKRHLKASPNARIISVSKMDGGRISCLCPTCKALDDAEGTNMAALLHLVNAVADAIKDDFPHVTVSTLAYLETVKPPRTMRPRKNVAIRLCSDDVGAWLRPFERSEVCEFGQLVKAWSAVHDRIHIWHYTVNFSHYLAPMPNMENIAQDIRFLVDNHAESIMTQGGFQSVCERDWLRSWVIAKLMWDPSLDLDALMHDFIAGYFGRSAPAIAEYNALLRSQLVKNKPLMTVPNLAGPDESIRYPMDHAFLSKDFLDKASALYDRAEELAENQKILARIERDRLPIMYVKLAQGPDVTGEIYGDLIDRFDKIARREGVTRLREGSPDLDEKLETWRSQWSRYNQ
jgi:hypothetical protein